MKSRKNSGFTLVEIMIVVAIIALLSAIAVPNFMKARKRSQANRCLQELSLVDAAREHLQAEKNLSVGTSVTWDMVAPYLMPGRLRETGEDTIGNPISLPPIGTPLEVSEQTKKMMSDVAPYGFWRSYDEDGNPDQSAREMVKKEFLDAVEATIIRQSSGTITWSNKKGENFVGRIIDNMLLSTKSKNPVQEPPASTPAPSIR